ncbi:MAG: hypothetical protein IT327_06680 [Anaerolineae bacterium]|nr:hypothetical protein [Anaerolineae bacterium]
MKTVPHFRIHWPNWPNWPNWRKLFRFWVLLSGCLSGAVLAAAQLVSAQAVEAVSLTIQLRHSDGTAVVGETVALERPPEAEPILPNCVTDESGLCHWQVGRGMYQLHFSRPLDEISALALAEGGLNGLGITVGDTAVSYHFTFHSDGRVYFDAAPEAVVPQPVLPVGELWHGGILPTLTPTVETAPPETTVLTPPTEDSAAAAAKIIPTAPETEWRLLGYIGGGLLLSVMVHLCKERRRRLAATEAPHA